MSLVVKVPLNEAQKLLVFCKKENLFDYSYDALKENGFLFFAIKDKGNIKKKFESAEFVEKELKRREQKETSLREALSKHFSEAELDDLIAAYDVVGSIAIINVPDKLKSKEKLIADTLLKTQAGIKTVLRKEGIHSGKFRTQKMKFLAGIDTRETLHKENNVTLKINVEDVYYSSRSSFERKRIASLVKPDESVLVMFSGCGPFTCVIAKNSKAMNVFGVELNPIAHKYAVENVKLNKLNNAYSVLGDARHVVNEFYRHILGLKSDLNPSEMDSRLAEHPRIFEFHLRLEDLFEKRERLEIGIRALQKWGVDVILHMPFNDFNDVRLSLDKENIDDELKIFAVLGDICKKYSINAVIHPYQPSEKSTKDKLLFVRNIRKLKKYFDCFFFENDSTGVLFGTKDQVLEVAEQSGMRNLCIDICHVFMVCKDNRKLIDYIEVLRKFNLYFHLADSDGISHGVAFGKGKIDLDAVLPFVKRGVIEVTSKDELNPVEMVSSFEIIASKKKFFDRIVMPLPKSAYTFLDVAFGASKKGTVIHLYTFLRSPDIPHKGIDLVEEAAKKAGKKIKILDVVKCGDYSPRTFRVCVDFEVL